MVNISISKFVRYGLFIFGLLSILCGIYLLCVALFYDFRFSEEAYKPMVFFASFSAFSSGFFMLLGSMVAYYISQKLHLEDEPVIYVDDEEE